MADLEKAPKIQGALIVCELPDYVRSPKRVVPYQIVARHEEAVNVSPDVKFKGTPATTMATRVPTVHGDEAGKAGIKSGTVKGECKPIANQSSTVKANGNQVLRHDTKWTMNCGNTTGKTRWFVQPNRFQPVKETGWKSIFNFDSPSDACAPDWYKNTEAVAGGAATGAVKGGILDPLQAGWELAQDLLGGGPPGTAITLENMWNGLRSNFWDVALEAFDIGNISDAGSDFIVWGDYSRLGEAIGRLGVTALPFVTVFRAGKALGGAAKAAAGKAKALNNMANRNPTTPLSGRYSKKADKLQAEANRGYGKQNAEQRKAVLDEGEQVLATDGAEAGNTANKKGKNQNDGKDGAGAGRDGVTCTQ